jgi:hypothetical protein
MKPPKLITLCLVAISAVVVIALFIGGGFRPDSTADSRPGDQRVANVAQADDAVLQSRPGLDGETPLSLDRPSSAPSKASIAGHWVNAGGECNSGEPFTLESSGEYFDEGSVGNWKLSGETLTITASDIEHSGLGPSEEGSSPRTTRVTLMDVTPDSLTWTYDDGRKSKFSRCP